MGPRKTFLLTPLAVWCRVARYGTRYGEDLGLKQNRKDPSISATTSRFPFPKKSGIISIYTMGVSIMKSPRRGTSKKSENATSKSAHFFPVLAYGGMNARRSQSVRGLSCPLGRMRDANFLTTMMHDDSSVTVPWSIENTSLLRGGTFLLQNI